MANLKNANILVTGASGFTGYWLTKYLIDNGANVTTLLAHWVSDSYYVTSGLINKVNNVIGNLSDFNFLDHVIKNNAISAVFHLAAFSVEKLAFNSPRTAFEINVRGTYNLLEACRNRANIEKIIIASSDKAYGDSPVLPYTEDMPLMGRHPYDCSKSCQDLIAQAYAHSYDLPIIIGRFGNIYGGGDVNWSRLIPGSIRRLCNGKPPIIRMPTSGEFKRDFLYINDLVHAYIALYDHLDDERAHGQAFNFAMGGSWTVLEIVNKIKMIMKLEYINPAFISSDHSEIVHQHVSTQKAASRLNWYPKYTLDQGLYETIQWYINYLENASLDDNFLDLIEPQLGMCSRHDKH